MFLRGLIRHNQALAGAISALAGVCLMFLSCSHRKTIDEVTDINTGTDPLLFTCSSLSSQPRESGTKAQLLELGFKVCTWKAFGKDGQFLVMNNYQVDYQLLQNDWNGTTTPVWDYTKVPGQIECFWDYSKFPYRFHAVAPYCTADEVSLSESNISINSNYHYQTVTNGLIQTRLGDGSPTEESTERHLVAQLERSADGIDRDLLAKSSGNTILNNSSTTLHRQVWLPFHHLNSKIRFGVYLLPPWESSYHPFIRNLTISVSSDDFTTQASGYQGSCNSTTGWEGDFTGRVLKGSTELTPLLSFDGGAEVEGNDLRLTNSKANAFFLQCRDGIVQIPQENVKMTVSFKMVNEVGTVYRDFKDVPLEYEVNGTAVSSHNWEPGYIYTYYLVIRFVEERPELSFTCSLTPWTDVSGNLSTDLEQ